MLSIVTARVARQNEQYNYVAVKGEKYLVLHEDGESASEKIITYLTPYAVEPVQIESVVVQKGTEIIGTISDDMFVYKAMAQEPILNENTGKIKRVTRRFYLQGNSFEDALHRLQNELKYWTIIPEITSISKTNIIEIK